jgi:hypothetical protein
MLKFKNQSPAQHRDLRWSQNERPPNHLLCVRGSKGGMPPDGGQFFALTHKFRLRASMSISMCTRPQRCQRTATQLR